MAVTAENRLTTLHRLIGEAEERCVEQVRLIGALVMAEEPVGHAIDGLEEIEDLLVRMRAERAAEQRGS